MRFPSLMTGLLLSLVSLVACKKTNDIDVAQLPGDGGNEDQHLPDCSSLSRSNTRGPVMAPVGRLDGACFWIDQSEVTIAQYQEFVANSPSDIANLDACKGTNPDFAPSADVDLSKSSDPVAGIDWCDAAAFCAWAGKTLCGSYQYGELAVSSYESTCTDGENAGFDYNTFTQGDTCNGNAATATVPVKSNQGCVTPTLVFDLVGNVREWTSECDSSTCASRGGSFRSTGSDWGCKAKKSRSRTFTSVDLGFRCCAEDIKVDGG